MAQFFHAALAENTYLISDDSFGTGLTFGKPTANSYLIVGENRALLFDLAVPAPGLRQYAQALAQKPLLTVISHGHPDHIYHMEDFDVLWLNQADWDFPLCALAGAELPKKCPQLCDAPDGMQFDLGGRILDVIAIPGHTMGSILLFDRQTGILFSGDAVARRLLYGLTGCPPLAQFCDDLQKLQRLPIQKIYSAHDRAALPPDYPAHMTRMLQTKLSAAAETWQYPGFPLMRRLVAGDEASPDFFDAAVPDTLLQEENTHAI